MSTYPEYPDHIDELRRLVQEGIDSGAPVDGPQAMKTLLAKYTSGHTDEGHPEKNS